MNRQTQIERDRPLWIRATSIASMVLLFVFTLAQATHSHGALPDLKGRHTLIAGQGTQAEGPDQCPLCAGGVGFFVPGHISYAVTRADATTFLLTTSQGRIPSSTLSFALSSRPPPAA